MRITAKPIATVVFLVALLAGCGGNNALQPSITDGTSPALKRVSMLPPGVAVLHGTALGTHALMHPNPCCVRTLFVSDYGAGRVQLYQFPSGTYQGQLPQPTVPAAPFSAPEGECVDTTNPQHVFIANSGASTVDEYTHNGTFVVELSDTGWIPISCSYLQTSPTTALLAVGNYAATSGASGSVSVYTENAGVWSGPVIHAPSGNQTLIYYVAYMNNKLYLDLLNSGTFEFMKMSPLGNFTPIPLFGLCPCPINFPGGVQAVGSYLAVGDQRPSLGFPNIYHIAPTGQVLSSTTLSPSPSDLVQFFRRGSRVVGPDAAGANADIYSYSSGTLMTPITTTLVQPVGSAVSHQ